MGEKIFYYNNLFLIILFTTVEHIFSFFNITVSFTVMFQKVNER